MQLLIIASAVFYCFFIPSYLLILLLVILVDYGAGLLMTANPNHKKKWLIASIISNIGILFFFKYYNFFIENCNHAFSTNWTLSTLILPIGLSFHTFQSLSYVIEVYKGRQQAENNLGYFALYVLYFPQLVAGPIERPQNMLHQFKHTPVFNWYNILIGARLILWGLFKKAVIADRISYYVNDIFNNTALHNPTQIIIGILFFSIQIYCDFSGYSDMAIGISKTFGIDLMVNFNRPYFAKNIQLFWQRWHVSLSTWFRDYVYFPLGGNRSNVLITLRNILVVFALSGFWHGAGWNFIIWGLLHALLVIAYMVLHQFVFQQLSKSSNNLFNIFSTIITFVLVSICWVFFRANTTSQALHILQEAFSIKHLSTPIGQFKGWAFGNFNFYFVVLMILLMFIIEYFADALLLFFNTRKWLDIVLFIFMLSAIIFMGVFNKQSFIYFQF